MISRSFALIALACVVTAENEGNATIPSLPPSTSSPKNNFIVTSVECGPKLEVIKFRYSKEQGVFVEVDMDTQTEQNQSSSNDNAYNSSTAPEEAYEMARKCWCTQYYERPAEYCPVDFADYCVVKRSADEPVKCFRLSMTQSLLKGLFPIMLFWYGLLIVAWFCSQRGRHARQFLRRQLRFGCCFTHTERHVEAIRESVNEMVDNRSRFLIAQLRRNAILRRNWVLKLEETQWFSWMIPFVRAHNDEDLEAVLALDSQPSAAAMGSSQSLSLKLKLYNNDFEEGYNDSQLDNVEEDEENHGHTCAICLKQLKQGDCVGDIPCGHVFHKECLKDWLRRKNSCPMCKRDDIAQQTTEAEPKLSASTGTNDSFGGDSDV